MYVLVLKEDASVLHSSAPLSPLCLSAIGSRHRQQAGYQGKESEASAIIT